MTTRIFIDGAVGTTGLEIRDRLNGRQEFELLVLDDAQRKDVGARKDALYAADVAILCLPDDAAVEAVKLAEGSGTRIIDASSAHRVADGWTYGFPELIGHEKIANARLVSNPGCYPTGFLALMAPLTAPINGNTHLPADWPYTVNAVSGYSGGGNALITRFESERNLAFRAYGLGLDHKHLPEMKKHARLSHLPVFSPSVIPAYRGMLVDIPVPLVAMPHGTSAFALWSLLGKAYEEARLVDVHDFHNPSNEVLLHNNAKAWDGLELFVLGDEKQARLIARLDNLGKGASGAAIQNLNIMCGLPETSGLQL